MSRRHLHHAGLRERARRRPGALLPTPVRGVRRPAARDPARHRDRPRGAVDQRDARGRRGAGAGVDLVPAPSRDLEPRRHRARSRGRERRRRDRRRGVGARAAGLGEPAQPLQRPARTVGRARARVRRPHREGGDGCRVPRVDRRASARRASTTARSSTPGSSPTGWSDAGFDDADWAPVEPFEWPLDALIEPTAEPIRRIEELAPVSITTSPSGRTVVDFGQNISGWVRFTRARGIRRHHHPAPRRDPHRRRARFRDAPHREGHRRVHRCAAAAPRRSSRGSPSTGSATSRSTAGPASSPPRTSARSSCTAT